MEGAIAPLPPLSARPAGHHRAAQPKEVRGDRGRREGLPPPPEEARDSIALPTFAVALLAVGIGLHR